MRPESLCDCWKLEVPGWDICLEDGGMESRGWEDNLYPRLAVWMDNGGCMELTYQEPAERLEGLEVTSASARRRR